MDVVVRVEYGVVRAVCMLLTIWKCIEDLEKFSLDLSIEMLLVYYTLIRMMLVIWGQPTASGEDIIYWISEIVLPVWDIHDPFSSIYILEHQKHDMKAFIVNLPTFD